MCDQDPHPRRPSFIQALGLLPPYSVTDVKKAYRDKARRLHPDAGGDPEDFKALTFAYEQALEYVEFRQSRRQWLGARIEQYAIREQVIDRIRLLGGHCRLGSMQEYLDEFGSDFAEVIRTLTAITLTGPQITDDSLGWTDLLGPISTEVRTLVLQKTHLTDRGLLRLSAFGSLRALDLQETRVSPKGLTVLQQLPALEWLHLGGTGVRFWRRRNIRKANPRLEIVTRRTAIPPSDSSWDDSLTMLGRLGSL